MVAREGKILYANRTDDTTFPEGGKTNDLRLITTDFSHFVTQLPFLLSSDSRFKIYNLQADAQFMSRRILIVYTRVSAAK